jgi:hypothetical protein
MAAGTREVGEQVGILTVSGWGLGVAKDRVVGGLDNGQGAVYHCHTVLVR